MTIKNRFPDVAPVLNLDFANSKRLDPRITFTRASTGTYVDELGIIRTAAANQARFDHDSAGNSLGLLIEESRTNSVRYSSELNNTSVWTASNCQVIPNSAIAPDGTMTADTMKANSGLSIIPSIVQNAGDAAIRTLSIYAKMGTYQYLKLGPRGHQYSVVADLSDGSVYAIGNAFVISADVIPAGNGWYRVILTTNITSDTRVFACRFSTNPDNNTAYNFTGDETIYLWGAQLETGSFPTSYIPTTSSTVTRSADVASMTGTNFSSWYNQSGGTLATNSRVYPLPLNYTQRPYCAVIMNSNGSQYWGQTWENCGEGAVRVDTTAGAIASNTGLNLQTNQIYNVTYKSALGIEFSGDVNVNGIGRHSHQGLTATNVSVPKNTAFVDRLTFGTQINGNGQTGIWQGHISRLTYYDRRLTDAQLQALTL